MLKDEIRALNDERQRRLQIKENRKKHIQNAIHDTRLYKAYQNFLKRRYDEEIKEYEIKTQKIIKNLPEMLKTLSRHFDQADIYRYDENFFIAPYLYSDMAKYYLDKRGKDIINFLEKNDINYSLHTENHVFISHYSIRVNFNI